MNQFRLFSILTIFAVRKNFLSVKETCRYLGLSERYILELIKQRSIPYYDLGNNHILLKKTEIDQWMNRSRVKSKSEIMVEEIRKAQVNNVFAR